MATRCACDDDAIDAACFERLVEEAAGTTACRTATRRRRRSRCGAAPRWPTSRTSRSPAVEIRRLDELRLRASELAVDAELADGHDQEALARLERLIEEHPLRERLHAQRMLALYGRVARPRRS